MDLIPFNRPLVLPAGYENLRQAVANGHLSGDGPFTKACHARLEADLGVPKVLLTTSCTHALEMSALLLNLAPGDEVIVPSFTFVSTVNAYALRGVTPVFCDVRPDTLNMDERLIPGLITPRTKAIVPVHYAGVGCDMAAITATARAHGIPVVEDNAHGLYAKRGGRWLGTFGDMATLSFHETKNFSCGEGGALLINDDALAERAEIIREKGTNRSRFFRGQVDKYTWVDLGSSFLPSDGLAALLLSQLEERELIQNRRRAIWDRYAAGLADWAADRGFRLPVVPADCDQSYHMFYLLAPDLAERTRFIAEMKDRQVNAVFHYVPLHLSDMGRQYGARPGDCPVTEAVSDRLVRLPFYFDLKDEAQTRVLDEVTAYRTRRNARAA